MIGVHVQTHLFIVRTHFGESKSPTPGIFQHVARITHYSYSYYCAFPLQEILEEFQEGRSGERMKKLPEQEKHEVAA